jgi:hypothetical protein
MKYKIEGNLNFFDELYKSLDATESNAKTDLDDNLCLITNQILTDNFVKLNCGHKFNYAPLYKDILNHKHKYNNMESSQTALTINEIRCPYCRTKQKGVLPFFEDLPFAKVLGVNYYNPNDVIITSHNNNYPKCEFLAEIILFNAETDELSTAPTACHHHGSIISGENYGDTKCYCYYHKTRVVKKLKKAALLKEKAEKVQEKSILKQKEKEEKQQLKKEQQQVKEVSAKKPKAKRKSTNASSMEAITNSIDSENVILGNMVIGLTGELVLNENYCNKILQSGINKGKQCSEKKVNNCLCRRHFKIMDKKEKEKEKENEQKDKKKNDINA